jgi:predicted ATPase
MICPCAEPHEPKRIVLTGGPGAGKTAVLELIRQHFCQHVQVLPESAGILFGGGFPRHADAPRLRATQRAIFYTQRELEACANEGAAIVLCDRGTPDGGAYWPGPGELWEAVGTSLREQLQRYSAVLHLRTPSDRTYSSANNPLRIESAMEAAAVDERILACWAGHPRRVIIEATPDFLAKAATALAALRAELPECCRAHVVPFLDGAAARGGGCAP